MEDLFFTVVGMSLTGSAVILFVLLARLALRRAPKISSYALWAVVLLRLLCPFALDSAFSLLPSAQMVAAAGRGGGTDQVIWVQTGIPAVDRPVNDFLADHPYQQGQPAVVGGSLEEGLAPAVDQLGPVPDWRTVPAAIWLAGTAALLGYSLFSLLNLRRKLVGSVPLEGEKRVRLADHIPTPFVLGVFRPVIYLPSGLAGEERDYILLHERTHIRRCDHVTRALAWLAVSVHWFDPLVWLAFHLAGRDMEMSCDEAVLARMGRDVRADYSTSLLRLSTGGRLPAGPLAFGGGNIQRRIKNVLGYKKPAFWVTAAALILVLGLGFALATDPDGPADAPEPYLDLTFSYSEDGAYVVLDGSRAGSMYWYPPGRSELSPLGMLSFGELELSNGWQVYGGADWTGEDRNAVRMELHSTQSGPVTLGCTVLLDPSEKIVQRQVLGGKENDPHLSDQEMEELAAYFARCIRGAEEFCANARPAPDDSGTELTFTMAQANNGPFLRVAGRVYRRELSRAIWSPAGADALYGPHPGGELTMECDFESGGASVAVWWADEAHSQVAVTTQMSVYLSSYMPCGWWEFTVDLSGEQGRVVSMEPCGGKTTLPGPVKMYPASITDQEAVFLARIAAKTMTAAEDFYNNYDGPIPSPPMETVRYTPVYSPGSGNGSGDVRIGGLGDGYMEWSVNTSPAKGSVYFTTDPAFFCPRLAGKEVEGSFMWGDEDRRTVSLVMNVNDERVVSGTVNGFLVHFVVDLEDKAVVKKDFESLVEGETLELTGEEMVYAAHIFADLLWEAEAYHAAQS